MRKSLTLIFLLITITIFVFGVDDTELWTSLKIQGKINDCWTFKFDSEQFFDNDAQDHYYTFFDIGFTRKFKKVFTAGVYFRHINFKQAGGWGLEFRPHLDLAWNLNPNNKVISLSSRLRIEYRIKNSGDSQRYRNKFSCKFNKFKIQPCLAIEPFYDSNVEDLNEVRNYITIYFPVIKGVTGDMGYILRKKKVTVTDENGDEDSEWLDYGLYTVSLKYKF